MAGRPTGVLWRDTIIRQAPFHFDPVQFDAEITAHGQRGQIRHGQICPCRRVETESPRGNCPSCSGVGWIYPESMRCETWMLLSQRSARSAMVLGGEVTTGTITAVAHSSAKPARGDVWFPCGEVHVVHQGFRRAAQQIDQTDLRAALLGQRHTNQDTIQRPRVERVLYPNATIETCFYEGVDGVAVEARAGVDFAVSNQVVTWTPGAGPEPGKAYTMRYTAPAAYIIDSVAPAPRFEAGQAMPWRCELSRLDKVQAADLR